MKDLKLGKVEFESVGEFLLKLKKKFRRNEKLVEVAELKKIKQEKRTIEKFIWEFRSAAKESKYERKALVEEFKKEINRVIRRKLIETERMPMSIEQWYECATNLDKYWRESKREEERLRRGK